MAPPPLPPRCNADAAFPLRAPLPPICKADRIPGPHGNFFVVLAGCHAVFSALHIWGEGGRRLPTLAINIATWGGRAEVRRNVIFARTGPYAEVRFLNLPSHPEETSGQSSAGCCNTHCGSSVTASIGKARRLLAHVAASGCCNRQHAWKQSRGEGSDLPARAWIGGLSRGLAQAWVS